ncbi:MAG: M20 metallopeptidase family protein [bacterium]
MKSEVLQKAEEIKGYLTKLRQHLHQNPELGMKEVETTALLKKELQDMGIEIIPLDLEVGVLGILRGEKEGSNKVTALRADIDALPIQEATGLPYASQKEGVMHACGHEGHTISLLGAAKLLSSMRDQFSGTVKFIFQPGEETLLGARAMVKAGVLENPQVDAIIMLHAWPFVEVGKIAVIAGPFQAAADKFFIKIKGSGGHGAYPHKSRDPLLTASHAVVALQSIVSRQIDAIDSVVLSVCNFQAGKAFNVIPEEVTLGGTVRTFNQAVRESIEGRMREILHGVTKAFGCSYELEYEYGIPAVVNHPEVIELIREAAKDAIGEENVEDFPRPIMTSEDFSVYLQEVPFGAGFRLGVGKPGEGEPVALHNPLFNFNDDALPIGAAVFTQFVLNFNQ